jgi:hypothetical protein
LFHCLAQFEIANTEEVGESGKVVFVLESGQNLDGGLAAAGQIDLNRSTEY